MTTVIFFSAFIGSYITALKNGASRVVSFGISVLLALVLTSLMKYVLGF